jgi:predicted ribosome quality control (RQC) complex YloA/Tae2 family protein
MKSKYPKFLNDLLAKDTLKEPLRDALSLLVMKHDSNYSFLESIQEKMNVLQEQIGNIAMLQEEMRKITQDIEKLKDNNRQQQRVQENSFRKYEEIYHQLNQFQGDCSKEFFDANGKIDKIEAKINLIKKELSTVNRNHPESKFGFSVGSTVDALYPDRVVRKSKITQLTESRCYVRPMGKEQPPQSVPISNIVKKYP